MIVLNMAMPASTAELVACLRGLLGQAIVVGERTVTASGTFPTIEKLTIDVTGATPLDRPAARWSAEAGEALGDFGVAALEVVGRPFGTGVREVRIEAGASNCRGEFARLADGATALRIAGAQGGWLKGSVTRANAEAAFLAEAGEAARAHGVEIKGVQMNWRTDGPRELSAEVLIKAKKGFLPTATVRVHGRLKIDESMTATILGLSVEGEGMVGSIGAGLLRPKLMKAEGMTQSLLALPLDAIRITDVRLVASDEALSVEGTFEG